MQLPSKSLSITLAGLLALGLAGSAGLALADPPPPPAAGMQPGSWQHPGWGQGKHGKGMMGHGMMGRWHGPMAGGMQARFAAMRDMTALQRLYLMAGRRGDAEVMYRQVLANTQDQALRNFAYGHLARLQAMPSNPDAAIATLRQALQENLKAIPAPVGAAQP